MEIEGQKKPAYIGEVVFLYHFLDWMFRHKL
jgi:hypothetical protein